MAFTWNGPKQDNPDIYVQQIGAGSPLRLTTDSRNDYNPVWSPDGRWIAFLRTELSSMGSLLAGPILQAGKSELRLIAPLGGPERQLAEILVSDAYVYPPYVAWCADSNCLVVTDSPGEGKPNALFVVSLETGEKKQLTNPQPPVLGDSIPAISYDGRSLVFRRNVSPGAGELYWLPLGHKMAANREPRRLTLTAMNARYPTWLPDGKEILFSAKASLWRLTVPSATSARLPFVGEDGLMPVVSRPQPGRLPRLIYVRSSIDLNIWSVQTATPTHRRRRHSSSPFPRQDWIRAPSFPPMAGGSPLRPVAPAKWKSGWLIRTGPTPSSSPQWALRSRGLPPGRPMVN